MMWTTSYRVPRRSGNAWWNQVRRLNRQMDYMFGGTRGPIRREFPLVNAWASEDGLLVAAEIPGVSADELDISIVGRNLTLRGSRQAQEMPEEARQYRRERTFGDFERTIELPFDVDLEGVTASYNDGLLHIELPRLPEEKPRKIALKDS